MRTLITPAAMRDMEQRFLAGTGTPSIQLMERAARELCDALLRRYGRRRRFWFACGPGGNGGDGYACARMIAELGGESAVVSADAPRSPDAIENLQRARAAGVPELALEAVVRAPDGELPESVPDVWVDALYGTGLARAPEDAAAALIDRMNADRARGAALVAVDIPSGLNGTTGSAWRPCAVADATFTFQYAKTGHYLGGGLDVCGALEVLDIGIPETFRPEDAPGLEEARDVRAFLPTRPRNLHKGSSGHLLVVAGSVGMAGAAALAVQAALRCGVGLVTAACPASVVPIVQTLAPCAMALALPEAEGALAPGAAEVLTAALPGKTAVVCGCGLSRRAAPEAVRLLLGCGLPALLDADALNLIAEDAALRRGLRPHHLITPHPGEAARLLGRIVTDPIEDAFALKTLHCQVLLKGTTSVIPVKNRARLSASGGCGMAKGGSGDCLSGVVGALMAETAARSGALTGPALAECAAAGSELHGRAGEIAQARFGSRGMCAQDIIAALPEAFREYGA